MKKVVLMAFAACLILCAACKNGGSKEDDKPVVIPESFATYDGEKFSIQYPGEMVVTWSSGFLNTQFDDGKAKMDASFSSYAPTESQLKQYAQNLSMMLKNSGETCDDAVIKGKKMTLRSFTDDMIKQSFCVLSGDGTAVAGSLSYAKELADTWDGYLAPVMASIKFK